MHVIVCAVCGDFRTKFFFFFFFFFWGGGGGGGGGECKTREKSIFSGKVQKK